MKKQIKQIIAVAIIIVAVFYYSSCAKKAETPEQKCKTCIALDNIEGAPVKEEQVCSDEAEQSFKTTYSDYHVSCE